MHEHNANSPEIQSRLVQVLGLQGCVGESFQMFGFCVDNYCEAIDLDFIVRSAHQSSLAVRLLLEPN